MSDNTAQKLVWGNSSKNNLGEIKPFLEKGNRTWVHLKQSTAEIRQVERENNPMCNMLY